MYLNGLANACWKELLRAIHIFGSYFIAGINCWILISMKQRKINKFELFIAFDSSILSFAVWLTFLILLSSIHKKSKKVIQAWRYKSWKSSTDKLYLSKFIRSCMPFTFRLGLFNVLPIRVIMFVNTIVWTTLKFLFAFRKFSF